MAENGILDYQGMNQAIYRGATSNIVVDTQSMSIEIGAGNSSHTSNLHIECDHAANVASIQLNSNVVTEFSRSKKLIKYPRVALTSAAQSSAGDYEGYIVNQSSVYSSESSHGAYLAFRGNSHWLSSSNSFDGGDDVFNGTNGPWISIQLPTKIKLEYLEFSAASGRLGQLITAGSVYASNNGSTWINIGSLDNLGTYTNFVPAHVNFTHTTLYDRYLLHVTANTTGYNYVHMEKLSLFGTPEYDPEAHGTDVTVKSYPNVPNTDWLEVYYDAKDLADGSITTVDDLTPSGTNDGTPINVTVSDGAFVFNGTDSRISSSITQSAGAYVHTAGLWYYTNDDPATLGDYIYQLGSGGTNTSPSIQISSGKLYISFMSNYYENPVSSMGIVSKQWVHIFYSYDGSATTSNSVSVYINGVKMSMSGPIGASAGTALSLGANPQLRVGCSYSNGSVVNGSIANFRLFNRALSSDEIYQLYAYQKEDFGHSTNNMTLKAGRLGIGTSEPRAALDVRGDIIGGMPVFFDVRFTSAPTATHAGSRIVFDTINNSRGGGFDKSTGTFTAPIAGQYKFSYFMRGNIVNQGIKIKPRINGSPTFNTTNDGTDQNLLGSAFCGNDGISGSAVCIVSLEVGGTFDLHACSHGSTVNSSLATFYNGFTGEYISSL